MTMFGTPHTCPSDCYACDQTQEAPMPELTTVLPRGAATTRVKTARLEKGTKVLTTTLDGVRPNGTRRVGDAQRKTGAIVREVDHLSSAMHVSNGFYGRAQRTYTVHFTDGTRAEGYVPIYTWNAVA